MLEITEPEISELQIQEGQLQNSTLYKAIFWIVTPSWHTIGQVAHCNANHEKWLRYENALFLRVSNLLHHLHQGMNGW